MLVSHLIRPNERKFVRVSAETPLSQVVRLLHERNVGAALVLDPDGSLAGVLSERDVVAALAKNGEAALGRQAHECANRDAATYTEDDDADDLVQAMVCGCARYVPVVDNGRVVGIVSSEDVVKSYVLESERQTSELREILRSLHKL